MQIANPIYGAAFKYLMQDDRAARLLVGRIAGLDIESLELRPQELAAPRAASPRDDGEAVQAPLALFRMDFAARVRTHDGGERQVLIEGRPGPCAQSASRPSGPRRGGAKRTRLLWNNPLSTPRSLRLKRLMRGTVVAASELDRHRLWLFADRISFERAAETTNDSETLDDESHAIMTKPSVYVETSVVSYLTARPSRDLIIAAQQAMTREWWRDAPERFVLVASELVLTEAAEGDTGAARARLTALEIVTRLDTTEDAAALTQQLLDLGAFPRGATADATHVSVAATNRVDYLLTWNLRHIAGAAARTRIERACREAGYVPPVICTPNELMEEHDHGEQGDGPDHR
ncbi:MAG: type II toxin-antitoxin system VapC family toxin [Defluviicoccus sp.]|nr:type II toxin-antitoxin system VapC family toxin [Defluviicoccus sp.]